MGWLVVENPATSSPGLAFLLLPLADLGRKAIWTIWKKLHANKVIIAEGWEDAYFGHFTAASKGDRPIVVSYASSPPAAVYYSEKPLTEAPTVAVVSANNAFRQIEFVGILKGTKEKELAEKFVDFMLGTQFQEDIPLQMFVFPANKNAVLPELFIKFARITKEPAILDAKLIDEKRDVWINEWTERIL